MEIVEQRHDWDCGIAAVATAAGKTYEEVLSLYQDPDYAHDGRGGLTRWQLQEMCWRCGYAIVPVFKTDQTAYEDRKPWPPEPFAERHVCNVVLDAGAHYVAWDGDEVYCPSRCAKPLRKYKALRSVTGLIPTDQTP